MFEHEVSLPICLNLAAFALRRVLNDIGWIPPPMSAIVWFLGVHGAVSGEIEQPLAGQHLTGVVDERREQIEFASGQPDLFARRRD
jgi:hypothetical protein